MRKKLSVKRLIDVCVSFFLLVFLSPFLLIGLLAIWLSDFHSPFFWTQRVGQGGVLFYMLKMRTMRWKADQTCSITPSNDRRITPLGKWLRQFKIDELLQFWNVFCGEMSLVGPRPDVYKGGVSLYSLEEKDILNVKPGIVDLASIFFSQEGEILSYFQNPEQEYYRLIFPLKKKLMLFYVKHCSFRLDLWILWSMATLFFSQKKAMHSVNHILRFYHAPPEWLDHYHSILTKVQLDQRVHGCLLFFLLLPLV